MSTDGLWLIQLLQILNLLFGQSLPSDSNSLIYSIHAAEPNDWTANVSLDPGQSDVAHCPSFLISKLLDTLDNTDVWFHSSSSLKGLLRSLFLLSCRASGVTKVSRWASKMPSTQRCPLCYVSCYQSFTVYEGTHRNDTNTGLLAETDHFSLLFSIQQVVLVLHTDKLCPSILLGYKLHSSELRCPHTRSTDVSYFSGLYEIMERFHSLFDWGVRVKAMNLEEIKVVGVQALEGSIDRGKDRITGESLDTISLCLQTEDKCTQLWAIGIITVLVDVVLVWTDFIHISNASHTRLLAHWKEAFGEKYHLMARNVIFLQGFSDDFLRSAVRIDVGSVPGIEAPVISCLEKWQRL